MAPNCSQRCGQAAKINKDMDRGSDATFEWCVAAEMPHNDFLGDFAACQFCGRAAQRKGFQLEYLPSWLLPFKSGA
jgi:hypothetical protein